MVIAGSGIAAAAAALWLAELDVKTLLLDTPRPVQAGVEALPEPALASLPTAARDSLADAGAKSETGFDNLSDPGRTQPGRFIHVDRRHLRAALLARAVARGVQIERGRGLPALAERPRSVGLADRTDEFAFAIDATGRSARWVGRTRRRGNNVAALYSARGSDRERGRMLQFDAGWAYALGVNGHTTAAVISPRGVRELDSDLATRLRVESSFTLLGRRPAFAQWAITPARERVLAIGDAALAYDPISGHGIRFAFSSAQAAASVVATTFEQPCDARLALEFYRQFVDSARTRHLAHLDAVAVAPSTRPLPERLRYTGETVAAGLQMNGRIRGGEALVLPNGGHARWIGPFDLLLLREWCAQPASTGSVVRQMTRAGASEERARALVRWCLDRRVLTGTGNVESH